MKKQKDTASSLQASREFAELKTAHARVGRIAAKLPRTVTAAVLERTSKAPVDELMSDDTRRRLIRRLIQSELHHNEFAMTLDHIADNQPVTLPMEITLDKDAWCMVARIARHTKRTLGEVVSEAAADCGMTSLCEADDKARSLRTHTDPLGSYKAKGN